MTFKDIKVGGLFVTGPSEELFIKLNNESPLKNVSGGHAAFLHCGENVWVPDVRIVRQPKSPDFAKLASKYKWNQIATVRMEELMKERD